MADAPAIVMIENLTKRELFAAMAMQGLLANSAIEADISTTVSDAVTYADELLAELAK